MAVSSVAQKAGVTLEKGASDKVVPLGHIVTYTLKVKNEGAETVNPTLTDALPAGLALQTKSVSATTGMVEKNDHTVSWSGTLAQGEEAIIIYQAIPPSTSSPDQTLSNVTSLRFGGTSLEAEVAIKTQAPDRGIWGGFINLLAVILVFFNNGLASIGVPYSFGFAIILFTVAVRVLTFPLNLQQIKSSKAMQALQPKMKALQEKYKDDKEKLAQEQMALYKEHGVNPLGGCLPMLVQMPIWFALYRSLIQLSTEGLLNEGFFWIPSLSGPVSTWGQGLSWLWPLPPSIGWGPALAYLVLPVLLVVSQLYMQKMMSPPTTDPQQASMQKMMQFMPLMFGYFALVVPSGLTLYWFTSNILAMAQQYFTKTQFDAAPASSKTPASSSTPANPKPANPAPADNVAPANPEEESTKSKNVRRSKRKKRRKH
jgi:YidC/Oxa1 family membrane protein insertase